MLMSPRDVIADRGWVGHLAMLILAACTVIILFVRDVIDMIAIWWHASTYNHCILILPIALWLVMQRKDEVAHFRPRTWAPGLALITGAALLWIVGEAAGIALFRHGAIVLMLQSLVPTVLGVAITRAVLFPLFYLSFMVPAGEELIPILQTITAKMSMVLLGLFGIPAHINGIFITIPNGYFKVAEACSGVKFLVAMVAYGALVANLCFRSWPRRIAFMAVSIVVPIMANGLRAFGTIYAAHLSSEQAAAGFDHVIYGWFFFAFVMALVMAIGWRFFDRKVGSPWLSGLTDSNRAMSSSPRLIAGLAIAVALLPLGWNSGVSARGRLAMPHTIALPTISGWTRVPDAADTPWSPQFLGADHIIMGHYANAAGDQVDVAIFLFAWQDEGHEVVGYGQGAVDSEGIWSWSADTVAPKDGKAERLVAPGPINREVVRYYVVGDHMTGSARRVKFETLKARLTGRDQAAAVILISAVETENQRARIAIDRFTAAMGSPQSVARGLIKTAQGR